MDRASMCHVRFARERVHVSEKSTEPPSSSLAQLSYDAALRALDGQERGLEELRARTGTLLAAASLVASFLGAQTIQRTNALETIEALALIALGVSVGAYTYVLLPWASGDEGRARSADALRRVLHGLGRPQSQRAYGSVAPARVS
jgi:hypothetical protein